MHNGLKLNQHNWQSFLLLVPNTALSLYDNIQVRVESIKPKYTVHNLLWTNVSRQTVILQLSRCKTWGISPEFGSAYFDESSTGTFVHAFLCAKLGHCNALIYGLPKYQLNRLQLVLSTAARVIACTRKLDHITHWLLVHYRILFKVLPLVLKRLATHYISDLLNKRFSVRSLRSNSQELLNIPKSRTKTCGDRAFSIAGPRLWIKCHSTSGLFLMLTPLREG